MREPQEFAAARIQGAINVPLSTFDPAEIPARSGQRVVFSCRSGVRSLKAVDAALMAGFDYDAHYPGGMLGWVAAGEPVEAG